MITMDSEAQLKVDIIAKVTQGKITVDNAAKLLNRSRRTIERYLGRYKTQGIKFIKHGNQGRVPANKIDDTLKHKVQKLIKQKYYDVNLQHLAELLATHENIHVKRETLRTWAHAIHHVKRAKKRRAKVRKKRDRMVSPRLLLQMDGSTHLWFGDEKSCLIALIDDATSELYAEFFPAETTAGCLKVLRDFIKKNGLFCTLYVDRAGIFGGPKRCQFSQVQRACQELGIEIIFAQSPQGKGRVERAFDTLQDRLAPELRLHDVTTIEQANKYLNTQFIPQLWQKKFVVEPDIKNQDVNQLPEHLDIDDICLIKEYRKIRNDHTFSYGNKMYLITSSLRHSIAKQKIEIRNHLDQRDFEVYFADQKLSIAEVVEPTKATQYDFEIQKKLDAIELAEKLGNVSEAARLSGCSRESIYKNRRLLKEKGPLALKRRFDPDKHHQNRTNKSVEQTVIDFSLENPHLGQAQVAAQLKSIYNIELSSTGVRNIWLRQNMNTCILRMQKAGSINAAAAATAD